jgi:8-oxo-dGTP pyrophosphatase MutT (NUDIX family)
MEIEKLRRRLNEELPGLASQLKAAPPFRGSSYTSTDIDNARQASVLWLMYLNESSIWEGVLIQRSSYEGVHSNQVGMPGGEKDEIDLSDIHTALRECKEEIGVEVPLDRVIGALTPLYIPPSKFYVRPYVAWLDEKPDFILDPNEVAGVLTIEIEKLCSEDLWSEFSVKGIRVPGFELEGQLVWGATAMMLSELVDCCREIFVDTFAK